MKNHPAKEKRSLLVFGAIFALLAASFAISGVVSYRNYRQQFRAQVERQISAIARLKVDGLVNWRHERLADANFIYENPSFSTLVGRYLRNPLDAEAQQEIDLWMAKYQGYEQYDQVCLLDTQGAILHAFSDETSPISAAVIEKIPAALQTGQITLVDFYQMNQDHHVYLTMLIPILEANLETSSTRQVIAFLALRIDPNVYVYPYIQQWPSESTTAETLLVRREGSDALFLNELRFQANTALTLRFPITNTEILAVKAALGQSGPVEGLDYRGRHVIGDVRAVPASPWFLVARMDTDEVYAPLNERLWQTLLLVGAAISLAGASLALTWRQQRVNFYRTQAETAAALRESEARYRSLFDNSLDGVALHEIILNDQSEPDDYIYLMANQSFETHTGIQVGDILGKRATQVFPDIQKTNLIEIYGKVALSGEPALFETYFEPLQRHYAITSYPVGKGQFAVVFDNITARKQAEAERERLLDELARKNKELEALVYIASHDLRSPLVNVQGFSRNLQKYFGQVLALLENAQDLDTFRAAVQPILVERIPRALQFVEAGSTKMDMLIDGLLRLSRVGRIQLQMETVDMDALMHHILDTMAFQLGNAHADLRVEAPLAACLGDRSQLDQVFSNLLDNAIKYRSANRPLAIIISSKIEAQKVTYCIADTGQGIAPRHQDKIWEIFRRFEDDAAVPGEGLGLALARRIIERHDGRIWVESEPGVGSCFYVELPLQT